MTSPEDPEERIRQLEQSAAAYGARELGTDIPPQLPPPVYPAPPQYGNQQPYGDPYQPPFGTQYAPVKKKSSVPALLIIGVIAVVFVVLGGIAAVVWNVSSAIEDSGIAGGGGSVDRPGGAPTYTPPSISFPSIPDLPGIPRGETEQTATPGTPASVSGIDGTKTVVCKDGDVSISGVNNTVTLTGHCGNVSVSGVENKITVDSADVIGASGFDNEIIYLSGDPEINNSGSNSVSRG
ncbi:DUF3060 domain-containing protein [Mycolicibacterium tusciae]|uniref:DUF3060 domain-containing protein n=1 Tax=Mycolicibacterium tusciae TaxID=75922 RepID=UPI000485D92F|nr:DUF3060 domain-containing protein [Mycolicibacterium tusciae]